jgi:hypothetical protein
MNSYPLAQRAQRFILLSTAALAVLLLFACLKKHQPAFSKTDSVDIAQTPIKNQFAMGFCWSYATIALIESNHKVRTGSEIDLSEEALGYVRMRLELSDVARKYRAGAMPMDEISKWLDGKSLEGWFVRSPDSSPTQDAMELIDAYGLVPEQAWATKFHTRDEILVLKRAISDAFKDFIVSSAPISNANLDAVMTADGAFHATPPKAFMFDGKKYTPQAFAREYLKFRSQDYVVLLAKSAADSRTLITATKKAMAAGFSIPVSFGVSMANLKSGFFSAKDFEIKVLDTNPELLSEILSVNGGHAVVATDFVNKDGREGALPQDELQREVAKPAEDLAYLKLKNSWGADSSTTENGDDVRSSSDGYYRMDYAYIKAVAAKGKFGVVVPRRFAP